MFSRFNPRRWLVGGRRMAEAANAETYLAIAEAVDAVLLRHGLEPWFPAAIDPEGGFHQTFSPRWRRLADPSRDLVYQARLTWTAARAAERFPAHAANFAAAQAHGLRWLADVQWDRSGGGFLWSVDGGGAPVGLWAQEKHSYGVAFGIYAAAGCFLASGDAGALRLAQDAFLWLDSQAFDEVHGGYRDVTPYQGALGAGSPRPDAINTPYGCKSANTHIHLLEAFTELYRAWPDPHVRQRLEALFQIVTHELITEPGRIAMVFTEDWRSLPGPESYGHAYETAYLLHEARLALDGHVDEATWTAVRILADRALALGGDPATGVNYEGEPEDRRKVWWSQAEALNALLLMHEAFGEETSKYWTAFTGLWAFIQTRQIDRLYGGWHPELDARARPQPKNKSDGWTECYHQARALFTVGDRLRAMARADSGSA